MTRTIALFVLGGLAACSDPEMEQRLKDLETKVQELEKRGPAGPAAAAPTASPEQEQAAAALLKEATDAIDAMNYDLAKAKVAEIKSKFADTRAAKAVARIEGDLDIIGKDAAPVTVDKWFQGSEADTQGKATMYVFWEVWCPHCKREVPKLAETYNKYGPQGFKVVGVTRMSKDVTEDQVTSFLAENKVTYPIAKDQGQGTMSNYYGVKGIPAAAVVKNGKVVWRGHPAKITDEMINKWVAEG